MLLDRVFRCWLAQRLYYREALPAELNPHGSWAKEQHRRTRQFTQVIWAKLQKCCVASKEHASDQGSCCKPQPPQSNDVGTLAGCLPRSTLAGVLTYAVPMLSQNYSL